MSTIPYLAVISASSELSTHNIFVVSFYPYFIFATVHVLSFQMSE